MFKFALLLTLISVAANAFRIQPKAGCSFTVPSVDPEPVVVTADTFEFLYPEPSANAIALEVGEEVVIACPGGTLSPVGATSVNAKCVSGTTFDADGTSINFNNIDCSRKAFHTARYTGKSCEANGKEIELGFILTDSTFARQITLCFDDVNLITLYSQFDLTRSIGHHESGVSRPSFIEDDFYNLPSRVNDLYERAGQRATINGLLGLSAGSTKYIKDSNDFFLSRGHFTAKADFVYAHQQTATFHYVNVAPQWQTCNGANWNTLEMDVRTLAEEMSLDLQVYTGGYGVTTLPHEETGEDIPLYLYIGNDGKKALPVPELYWKVVYNPATHEGIALLQLNNPYQDNVEKSIICEDVSSKVTWLNWKSTDIQMGYSYACAVDDLRNTISYIPELDIRGLLL